MYAANEGGTIGAVNAVLAAGQIGQTYVMGTDATAELMNFVSDGEILLAVNSQFPRDMGAGAMRAALKAVKGEARYSFPLFLHPNPDWLIESLPSCIDDDHPDLYPEGIMADDFLQQRLYEIKLL